jgi:hypothetical protein
MSALATFELPKGIEPPTLALREAWRGEFVSILVEQSGRTTVGLGHWYRGHEAAHQLQNAVRVLLRHLAGRPLYYFRDADCLIEPDKVSLYSRPLSVSEIVTEEFEPAMHNGVHYRFLIHDDVT